MKKLVLVLVSAVLGTGCDASRDLKDSAERIAKALETASNNLALAVPGERYMRLIDATNSDNPEIANAAKHLVQKIFDLEPEDDRYRIVLKFAPSKEGPPLHLYLRTAGSYGTALAKALCEPSYTPRLVNAVVHNPQDRTALEDQVRKLVVSSLGGLEPAPAVPKRSDTLEPSEFLSREAVLEWGRSHASDPGATFQAWLGTRYVGKRTNRDAFGNGRRARKAYDAWIKPPHEYYAKSAAKLSAAILSMYAGLELPVPATSTVSEAYSVLSGHPYLFIYINDEEFAHYADGLEFSVALQHAQDSKRTYKDRPPVALDASYFLPEPVICGTQSQAARVVWVDLLNVGILTEDVVENAQRIDVLLERWEKYLDKRPSGTG